MHCTLLIPALFWPRETAEAVLSGIELPDLTHLVSRAQKTPLAQPTVSAWLCESHGIARQGDWPIAPFTAALDGIDPADAYWLRADPVHMRVERSGLTFVGNALLALSAEESAALAATLTAHFEAAGIAFHAPSAQRWYFKAAQPPELRTHDPHEMLGADVQTGLPSGADALHWHGIFNEAQMLLHTHPVNVEREERGAPPANSIWLWGGGVRSRATARLFTSVWSDNAEASAVCASSGARTFSLPADARTVLSAAGEGASEHLVVLDHLTAPAAYHDAGIWRERLVELESAWFSPLAAALRRGALDGLTFIVPGRDRGARFDVTRGDLMKFWRVRKPLSQLA